MKEWQLLQVPATFTAGRKAAIVRAAKNGQRPDTLSPQQWAWSPLNPNGIRRSR